MSERLSQEQVLMHAMTLCHENVGEETAHRMASELLLARAVVEAARAVKNTVQPMELAPGLRNAVKAAGLLASLRAFDEGGRDVRENYCDPCSNDREVSCGSGRCTMGCPKCSPDDRACVCQATPRIAALEADNERLRLATDRMQVQRDNLRQTCRDRGVAMETAEAQRDAAVALLREVEWLASGSFDPACNWCGEKSARYGSGKHAPDCRLAAILNENPQPPDAGSE